MKLTILVLMLSCIPFWGSSQTNVVYSGGELANYNIVDISAVNGVAWTTERTAVPGYFSAIDTATYVGCSDSANINGYIKKYGNQAFIFPVGNGKDLRSLEISAPAASTDAYATAWIEGNPNVNRDPTIPYPGFHSIYSYGAPLVAISPAGQWDWQVGYGNYLGKGTTGSGFGLTITVSIPDMTSFSQASYLRLVGWNGARWIDLSGKATASGNTENSTLSGTMIAEISAIAIGRVASSLAVKLDNFHAESSGCNAILTWNTFNEVNTEAYIIEQSLDGVNFHSVSSLIASGFTNGKSYSMVIPQPNQLAYYRLKIKDNDGTYTYSDIITSRNNCDSGDYMLVYPNPVSAFENLNVRFSTSFIGKAECILFNGTGQRIMNKQLDVSSGVNTISIEVKNLTVGTYFIVVLGDSGKQLGNTQKFIRQ
jgi:hypothetical protein